MSKSERLTVQEMRMIRTVLREVQRVATMESAKFGNCITQEPDPTPLIKERTRIWRESWIIAPLAGVLALLDQKLSDGGEE